MCELEWQHTPFTHSANKLPMINNWWTAWLSPWYAVQAKKPLKNCYAKYKREKHNICEIKEENNKLVESSYSTQLLAS